jgi:predicted permease
VSAPLSRIPIALRLAAWLLPDDAREEVLGDLVEVWRERVRTQSRWARARWLVRQPCAALRARVIGRGPRGRVRPADHGPPGRAGREADYGPPGASARTPDRRSRGEVARALVGPKALQAGIGFSWLDVRLGVRMLGKQPVLTIVAGLTLALGIPTSLMPTHVMGGFDASFPVEDGDRIVGIRNWDVHEDRPSMRPLHDFAVWKEDLRSFEVVSAARSDPWNVHSPDGRAAEVRGAEVSASAFDMLRVPPLLGRTLIRADEVEGAPDVVVISEDLWASRFARDPEIVGAVIAIGRRPHTVVGVMPEGFLFPLMDHLWLPLRANPNDYAVGTGPDLYVFGRLADGVSREQATVELETIGARLAAAWPETHQALRPELVTVPLLAFGEPAAGRSYSWEILLLQLFCFALLTVACGNVGVLILARTATRVSEISVRTALGASRARILSQLFIEALVLAVGATGVGLVLADLLVGRVAHVLMDGSIPYWFDLAVGPRLILLALGLAAACAVVAGVLPAIKATSPNIQRNLQRNSGGTTVRFGPFTTLLVVAEVTLSVGFLCLGTAALMSFMRDRSDRAAIDVDRYLVASLRTPWVDPTDAESDAYQEEFRVRTGANHEELRDRLVVDGAVRRAAMGIQLPGIDHPDRTIVLEGDDAADDSRSARVVTGRVHVDYFSDLGIEVLQGRGFSSADVAGAPDAHRPAIVVNDQLVDRVFGGGNPIGRRIRYAVPQGQEGGDWFEIVGVVETFGTNILNPDRGAALYHPLGASDAHPMRFVIEVADDPAGFVPRLRQIAAEVDADAMIQAPRALTELVDQTRLENRLITLFTFILSSMGMVLAATGLYALMSFTVSQRTREIGIRTALGAGARNVVAAIARRAFLQLVAGVALGSVLGWWLVGQVAEQSEFAVNNVPGLLLGVAAAVMAFSALACLAPTLRGLRIQPTEALREGG